MLHIIVGLGNPGDKYACTRHNMGFRVIDRFAEKVGIKIGESLCHSLVGTGRWAEKDLILAKPQTHMNESGVAVKALLEWYKVAPGELLIIYDDVELEPGKLRLRRRGSHGGHNGVKSIISQINTEDFPRLRVGIGRAPEGGDLIEHVLGRFDPEEEKIMADVEERASQAIMCLLSEGIEVAMNRFN